MLISGNIFIIAIIVIFLMIFQKIILFFQYKIIKSGYDHYFHLSLIKQIKSNKNKFIKSFGSYLQETNLLYPQLFHWLLSFLPEKFLKERYNKIGQLINFFTLISFVFFANTIYSFLKFSISCELFLLYSGLAFTLSPFNFFLWNAKNCGISVRGFGLLLAYLYLYCIVWLNLSGNSWFYLPIFILSFIVLLSNQFAFQFILFSMPFFAFFFKNIILILPPFVSFIIYVIFFREIAFSFFKGQYYHKKLMFKYIAKNGLLKRRHSVYRDFFWDFWKKRDLKYFLNNPIISIFLGFPFLSVLLLLIFKDYSRFPELVENFSFYNLLIPIIVGIIVFFITSFRFSRFLGEPERYVEFGLPFFSILSIIYLQDFEWLFIILISFSFTYIIYQYALFGFQINGTDDEKVLEIKNYIRTNFFAKEYKIFSNNTAILNFFIDEENWKILHPYLANEYTGKFHFTEIYPEQYFRVNPDVILPLIEEFEIEWFILFGYWLTEENLPQNSKVKLEKMMTVNDLILYKVNRV